MQGYRRDIDGLRAIAVGSVVLFHAGVTSLMGGFTGVDIFFVISGFLITGLLVQEAADYGRISISNFYARRVRRLFPALALMLISVMLLAQFLLPAEGTRQDFAKSVLAAMGFVANFFYMFQPSGYFAPEAEAFPLLHTWTLAVEEQFYLVWPLLIWGMVWAAKRWGLRIQRLYIGVFCATLLVSFGLAQWAIHWRPTVGFYFMPLRAWEFAVGALIAVLPLARWQGGWTRLFTPMGLTAMIVGFFTIDGSRPFPDLYALLPVLGAGAVIWGGMVDGGGWGSRLLATAPMTYLGKLSYGLYLWHWPLLALVRGHFLGDAPAWAIWGAVALAILLSAISYHCIETPIRHQKWGWVRGQGRSLRFGAAAMALVMVGALGTWQGARAELASSPRLQAIHRARAGDLPGWPAPCANYQSHFVGLAPVRSCSIGDRQADKLVVLIGDSHAYHLLGMFDAWGRAARVGVLPRTRGGCRPIDGAANVIGASWSPELSADCARTLAAMRRELAGIAGHGEVASLVLAARWPRLAQPPSLMGQGAAAVAARDAAWEKWAQATAAWHVPLTIIVDTPAFPHNVRDCLARRDDAQCALPRAAADRQRAEMLAALQALRARHPHVAILDLTDALCDRQSCPAIRDNMVLWRDANHLSLSASRMLAEQLRAQLDAIKGGN